MPRAPLGREVLLELGTRAAHEAVQFRGIDEGIWDAVVHRRALIPKPEEVLVVGEEHVRLHRFEAIERAQVVLDDARVLRIGPQPVDRDRRAAIEDRRVTDAILDDRHRPGRAPARMAWRDMGGEHDAAERHSAAVFEDLVDPHGRRVERRHRLAADVLAGLE
jgi:hypothetical protein